jgi:hypothetical protein
MPKSRTINKVGLRKSEHDEQQMASTCAPNMILSSIFTLDIYFGFNVVYEVVEKDYCYHFIFAVVIL